MKHINWTSLNCKGSLIDELMKTKSRESIKTPFPLWPTNFSHVAPRIYGRTTPIIMEKTEIQKIEIEATRGGYVVDIGCEDFIYPTAEAMCRDLLAYLTSEDKREFEKTFLAVHPKGKAL